MDIQIYREETYPMDLLKLRRQLIDASLREIEILQKHDLTCDFLHGKYKDSKPSPFLCSLVENITSTLETQNIVVFHNTRLLSANDVLEKGLMFPDENYEQKILDDMKLHGIRECVINELEKRLLKHKTEVDDSMFNKIYFYYDLDAQYDFQDFFKCFGGELIARATGYCRANDECDAKFRKVVELGKPYRVKFNIPFSWFSWKTHRNSDDKIDIAKLMLAYWIDIHIKGQIHDRRSSGWIGVEIPPENIESVDLIDIDLLTHPYDN